MNGRIYDPLLGRFLSADIVVQNQGDLQAFNRYSYVLNRPLTMTDPTGFFYDISPLQQRMGLQAEGASQTTVDKATATWQMGDAARSQGTLTGSAMVVSTVATAGAAPLVYEAAAGGNVAAQVLIAGTAAKGLTDGTKTAAEGAGEFVAKPSVSSAVKTLAGAAEATMAVAAVASTRSALASTVPEPTVASAAPKPGLAPEVKPATPATAEASTTVPKQRNTPPAPLKEAEGRAHTIIEKKGATGQYTTHNKDGTWKQYRGSGKDHGNVPRPNVKETKLLDPRPSDGKQFPSKPEVRPAKPDEIPK